MTTTDPGTLATVLPKEARVEVRDVRREVRRARIRLAVSILGLVGVPWGLGALGVGNVTVAFLAACLFYLWSAQSLAATDPGVADRKLEGTELQIRGGDLRILITKFWHRLPLSQVTAGWVESTGAGYGAVMNFADGRSVVIELPTEDEASKALRALAPNVETRALRMRAYPEDVSGRRIVGCLFALLVPLFLTAAVAPLAYIVSLFTGSGSVGGALGTLFGGIPLFALGVWLWGKLRPTWIQVGADGVLVPDNLRKRFIPHAEIARVEHRKGGVGGAYHFVHLFRTSGGPVVIPTASETEARAIIDRIQRAKRASSVGDRARLLDVLARSDRPVVEWRQALSGVLAGTGYRSAGAAIEDVLQIVEDPRAPIAQRVAAVIAARSDDDPRVKDRIRVAAEACVEPRLRVALDKASRGDLEDAELEEIARDDDAAKAPALARPGPRD